MAKYSSLTDKQVFALKGIITKQKVKMEFGFFTELDQVLNSHYEQLEWNANGEPTSNEVKQLQKIKTKLQSALAVPVNPVVRLSLCDSGYDLEKNILAVDKEIEKLNTAPNDRQIYFNARDALDINIASIIKRLTNKKPTATQYGFFSEVLCILFDCKNPHIRCEKALHYIS